MSERHPSDIALEPERYELHAAPQYRFELDRREFFQTLGGGLVVLLLARRLPAQHGRRRRGRPSEVSAWLHIDEEGTVTAYTGKAEVGQNIRTSLSQAVAEELRLPVSSVRLVMSDTDRVPYDRGTFGSRTTPDMAAQLHRAAAAARKALLDLAAEHFQADRSSLVVADGAIRRKGTGKSVSFAELTRGQKLMTSVTEEAPVTPPQKWSVAGTSVPKVDARAFVTGHHRYASDVKRPEMVHGKILRPPAFEATLQSIDTSGAESIDGVTVVRDGDFVGVTAPDELTATRALESIQAEWTTRPQVSSAELFEHLRKTASSDGGPRWRRSGDSAGSIEKGLAAADHKREATFTIAYIAHTPLEPRAAVAEWAEDKLTVWTGTQRPFGVRSELARAFDLPEERIRVLVPDTGSGYGGKHTGEAAVEAARLAQSAGRPVKLVWTREEEFTWAYFRPAGVIDASGGVRKDGTLTAWEFHNYNSGGSAIETPYEVPNRKTQFHGSDAPLRQGSYRALAATANHFAREVHMDELARAVEMDPLEFRLKNLKNPRLRAVLESAAEAFGWKTDRPAKDRGIGIAGGTEKGSYIATCAEVSVDRKRGTVNVERVTAAFDCGAVVNPDHLKNQVEGCAVMGLGGALSEAVEFEDGKITNPRFSNYRVPRFRDAPSIEVVLLDRKDIPSAGAGETPIITIAPAVSNAIFDAVGVRLRSLPMVPNGLDLPSKHEG